MSFPRIVLLAAREEGYRSLLRLTSRAYLETAQTERPHLKLAWLAEETPGLIALSGGPGGPLDTAIAAGQGALAAARCETLHRLYGDRLYIELQRHGMAAERLCEPALIELAYARGLPLVATNEPFFAAREDYEAHDALLCIAEGRLISDGERRQLTAEHRLKTRAEMAALFADLPEALAATVEIAQRCAFRPRTRAPILPRFLRRARGRPSRAGAGAARGGRGAASRRGGRAGAPPRAPSDRTWPQRGRLSRAAGVRARRHRGHEIRRLLPHRRRFHPMGEGARHSGRAGPRLRRRLARRLRAHHHRSRSDPLRAAVRALPQSRARVDARLRRRFLPGAARRGDPLRAGEIRPRPGGADHHLRHLAGARRAARRRARAADAVRPGRQALQAGAAKSDEPDLAQARDRRRAAAAGRARRRPGDAARLRHRAEARRPHAPRLHPRRRHRHRRPAAERIGAALPRPEIADAGDPVQHEMGRARRAW